MMRRLAPALLLTAVALLLNGCAGQQNYGTLQQRTAVTLQFERNEIVAGYDYFYAGTMLTPTAILGVDSRYTVQGTFWKPVDITEGQLEKWVTDMNRYDTSKRGSYRGAEILAPDGTRAGIWYSNFDHLITIFPGGDVIQVYPPSMRAGAGAGAVYRDRD